jgi:hypothetical protein
LSQLISYIHINQKQLIMSKTISLSDLEWDFSDEDEVTLSLPKGIELIISKDELNSFIESWKENFEDESDE